MAEYVNRGTDPRIFERIPILGPLTKYVQTWLSFHSRTEPLHVMMCLPPYVSIAIPWPFTSPRKYFTLRAGWRYDKNWPGYIFDVILKARMDHVVPYLLFVALTAAGCGAKQVPPQTVRVVETVEVKVPVLQQRVPPPELLEALKPPLPVFVAPEDPNASSALTPEGERLLRGMIEELLGRIDAWRAWAEASE